MLPSGQPVHQEGETINHFKASPGSHTLVSMLFILVCVQHAQRLYRHVYLTCKEESSGRDHYQALVTLLAVVSVELANEEVVVDLIRLVLGLQVRRASVNTIRTRRFCLC